MEYVKTPPIFVLNWCHQWSWAFAGGCHSPVALLSKVFEMLHQTPSGDVARHALLPEPRPPLHAPSSWFPRGSDLGSWLLEMSLVEMLVLTRSTESVSFPPADATCPFWHLQEILLFRENHMALQFQEHIRIKYFFFNLLLLVYAKKINVRMKGYANIQRQWSPTA